MSALFDHTIITAKSRHESADFHRWLLQAA